MVKTSTLAVILAALIISVVFTGEADGAGLVKRAISTVGTWAVSDIPSLPASKITSGTFAKTMISSSGTFPWSEISKTGSSIHDLANVTSTGCAVGQVLKVSGTTWQCAADNTGAGGITSINGDSTAAQVFSGTANNMTITDTGAGTLQFNLASNVLTTGGSAQTITKGLTINSGVLGGQLNINGQTFLNTGTITFPTATGTLATLAGSETLSGKTLTNPSIDGLALNYTKTTATSVTLNQNTDTVIVSASGANPTIVNLPSAISSTGKLYYIQKNDTSGNTVMIKPSGTQRISGGLNANLTTNMGSIVIISDGANWQRLDRTADEANSYRTTGTTHNRWYGSAVTSLASSTIVSTPDLLRAYPFVVPRTITIDQIKIDVTTAGTTTTLLCRMGIYTEDGNTYPYKLVSGSDVATFTHALAVKTNTFTSPITLKPGLYFLAHVCENNGTTEPTFRGVAVGAIPSVLGYTSTMGVSQMGTAWSVAFTETGGVALPATYPSGGTIQVNLINAMILVRIIG